MDEIDWENDDLSGGIRFVGRPPRKNWMIASVGERFYACKCWGSDEDVNDGDPETLYDPDSLVRHRAEFSRVRLTKGDAKRLVNRMRTKAPMQNVGKVQGHPRWGRRKEP
jgi:hypothetical protein